MPMSDMLCLVCFVYGRRKTRRGSGCCQTILRFWLVASYKVDGFVLRILAHVLRAGYTWVAILCPANKPVFRQYLASGHTY